MNLATTDGPRVRCSKCGSELLGRGWLEHHDDGSHSFYPADAGPRDAAWTAISRLIRLDLHCEHYVGVDGGPMFDGCQRNGRLRDGEYGAERWCLPCEVRSALSPDILAAVIR